MKLTDKQMKQIQDEINKINQIVIKREEDPQSFRRIKELRAIREKNEEIDMKLVDCCFFGPLSVKDLLKGTDYEIELQDRQCSLEIIIALENVLGKSTIMEYDKSKNIVEAKTPKDGYKLEYDPKDVELGLWDKICAFFGIKTDHAKKVEFAQKSIQAQKDKLDGFNRNAVKKKKSLSKHLRKKRKQKNSQMTGPMVPQTLLDQMDPEILKEAGKKFAKGYRHGIEKDFGTIPKEKLSWKETR